MGKAVVEALLSIYQGGGLDEPLDEPQDEPLKLHILAVRDIIICSKHIDTNEHCYDHGAKGHYDKMFRDVDFPL